MTDFSQQTAFLIKHLRHQVQGEKDDAQDDCLVHLNLTQYDSICLKFSLLISQCLLARHPTEERPASTSVPAVTKSVPVGYPSFLSVTPVSYCQCGTETSLRRTR